MRRLVVFLAVLIVFNPVSPAAEESSVSFVVAPPPVGFPDFEEADGKVQTGAQLVYVNQDLAGERLTVAGAAGYGNYQQAFGKRLALNGSLGTTLLIGSLYDLYMVQIPLNVTAILNALDTGRVSLFLFAGGGGSLGLSSMTMERITVYPITDVVTMTTYTVLGSMTAGAQLNLFSRRFVLSPFAFITLSGGTYQLTQDSPTEYSYPSYSGTIDNYSSTVIGFDLLYRPKNISLASQFRNTPDYRLLSLALKWFLKPKG
jgi:hypothetical protein